MKSNNNNLHGPFVDPCNCFFLRRAARAATRQYADVMKPTGLKATQFSLLAVLSELGEMSITEMASQLGLERTSLSRTLNPMVREKLIAVSDEGPRRTKTVSLTSAGRNKFESALPLWQQAQGEFSDKLGTEEVQTLVRLLRKISDTDESIRHS